MLPYFVRGDVT